VTRLAWAALIALAVFVVIVATSLGVGVSPDSTAFIGTARRWLQQMHVAGINGPISRSTYFGPLYPLSLTIGSAITRLDPRVVARWLNVVAFPANLLLAGMMVRRAVPAAKLAPVVAALVILTSIPILTIHTMAWTEPAFLCLFLIDVAAVDRYLRRPTRFGLALIACVSAACVLQRFAGLSCIAMSAIALFAWGSGTRLTRVRAAAIVAAASLLPLWAWIVSSADHRSFYFHPAALTKSPMAIDVAAQWIVPSIGGVFVRSRAIVVVLIALLISGALYANRRSAFNRIRLVSASYVLRLLGLFVGCYVATLALSLMVWDAQVDINPRMLAPLELAAIVALAALLSRARRVGPIPIVLGLVWLSFRTVDAAAWVARTHRDGQWYASRLWQQSPTMQWILTLRPDAVIVTNGDDAVGAVIDRRARRLPDRLNPGTTVPNPDYAQELAALHARLRAGNGVIVLFDRLRDRTYIPDENELSKVWKLSRIAEFPDGVVYRLRDD